MGDDLRKEWHGLKRSIEDYRRAHPELPKTEPDEEPKAVKGDSGPPRLPNMMTTGAGTPKSSFGVVGETYFDMTNQLLYTKTGSGWGTGVPMVGGGSQAQAVASKTPGVQGPMGVSGSMGAGMTSAPAITSSTPTKADLAKIEERNMKHLEDAKEHLRDAAKHCDDSASHLKKSKQVMFVSLICFGTTLGLRLSEYLF